MAVRLSVYVPGERYHQSWWVNFCLAEVKLESVSDEHPLTKWGGKMRPGSWIEFEREEEDRKSVV
jgi:hypothetical protein